MGICFGMSANKQETFLIDFDLKGKNATILVDFNSQTDLVINPHYQHPLIIDYR